MSGKELKPNLHSQRVLKGSSKPADICLVDGSKDDRCMTYTDAGMVERVWILSRPPESLSEPSPTVSARRREVMQSQLQGSLDSDAPRQEKLLSPPSRKPQSRKHSVPADIQFDVTEPVSPKSVSRSISFADDSKPPH